MSRVLRVGSFWRLTLLFALMALISLGGVRTTAAAGGGDGTGGGHGHGQHRGQQIGATPSQPGANPSVATPWANVSPASSPQVHLNYGLAADPNTGHVIMFGGAGFFATALNDTWVWDGAAKTWTQVVGAPGCTTNCLHSPPPRRGGLMAYDPTLKTVILFGGVQETSCCPFVGTIYNDTWSYDDTLHTWAQIAPSASLGCTSTCPSSPSPRVAPALATNATTGHPLLLGGNTAGPGGCLSLNGLRVVPGECAVNDIWSFTGTGWTQVSPDMPGVQPYQRVYAAMAANVGKKGVILFGGVIRDLYDGLAGDTLLNSGQGAAFIQIANNPHPFARSATGMAATTLPQTGLMIFGGRVHNFILSADTWVLSSSTNTWVAVCGTQFTPDCGPPASKGIQLATDPATGTPMFFGEDQNPPFGPETWRFSH